MSVSSPREAALPCRTSDSVREELRRRGRDLRTSDAEMHLLSAEFEVAQSVRADRRLSAAQVLPEGPDPDAAASLTSQGDALAEKDLHNGLRVRCECRYRHLMVSCAKSMCYGLD